MGGGLAGQGTSCGWGLGCPSTRPVVPWHVFTVQTFKLSSYHVCPTGHVRPPARPALVLSGAGQGAHVEAGCSWDPLPPATVPMMSSLNSPSPGGFCVTQFHPKASPFSLRQTCIRPGEPAELREAQADERGAS